MGYHGETLFCVTDSLTVRRQILPYAVNHPPRLAREPRSGQAARGFDGDDFRRGNADRRKVLLALLIVIGLAGGVFYLVRL